MPIRAFVRIADCIGLKNPDRGTPVRKQCQCKPKEIRNGLKLCGTHFKKEILEPVFDAAASTIVPRPRPIDAPVIDAATAAIATAPEQVCRCLLMPHQRYAFIIDY